MSTLERIAFYQNRRDEVPNQELARELADARDAAGIREIATNLWNRNKSVRSDCLKVLYEIAYIDPSLIADYVGDFLRLMKDKDNRMVWGGMIALASVADLRPREIWPKIEDVIHAVETGTLITVVWGVRALAKVAAADPAYRTRLLPVLLEELKKCIPRDVPTHAESMLCAVDAGSQAEFLAVIESRKGEMTASHLARLKKVTRKIAVISK